MQRPSRDTGSTPSSTSSNARRPSRQQKPKRLAEKRDEHRCVLLRTPLHEVAHIFPRSMINPKKPRNLDGSIPDFWKLLDFFYEPERLNRWRAQIFRDPSNPSKTSDGCHNMICLDSAAHDLWARGLFALHPVVLFDDQKEITVQFFWQRKPSHHRLESVDLLNPPLSVRDLTSGDGTFLYVPDEEDETKGKKIKSGDIFIFKTANPETHPLPSFDLLEMQWHLNRIVSMSGAAAVYDESDDDNDDDDEHGKVYESPSEILTWIPPPPSSKSSDEDSSERHDESFSTLSTAPSFLKTLESQRDAIWWIVSSGRCES